jgi:hypothetical protein
MKRNIPVVRAKSNGRQAWQGGPGGANIMGLLNMLLTWRTEITRDLLAIIVA